MRRRALFALSLVTSVACTAISVDDFASVQAALQYAADAHNGVGVVLFSPQREYRLGATAMAADTHALTLTGARNLIIDGQGAFLVINNPALGVLRLAQCENVSVARFTVDYDPLPNAQGVVAAVDTASGSVVVQLDANETLAPPYFASAGVRWGLIKDRHNPRRQKPGLPNCLSVQHFQPVAGRAQAGA